MSIKTVLVHVDPGPGCNPRVQLAMHVADLFDADLIGLGAEAFDPVFVSGYAATDGVVIEAIQERIAADLPAAEKHFRALTSGRERIAWVKGVDYPDKLLALNARGADLIVASRPARGESPIFAARLADTIMEAGVPVLLAATTGAAFQGDRIVVAWKDTRESRRALGDALPFLKRAKAVVVVAVCGEADTKSGQAGAADVARRLAAHGVEASVEVVAKGKATVAEVLEDVARRHSADLIVAGAYGHSRLREWALGGVTEDFLASCPQFVLLSH